MASILVSPSLCSSIPRSNTLPSFSTSSPSSSVPFPSLRLRKKMPLFWYRRVARPLKAAEEEIVVSEVQEEEMNVEESAGVAEEEQQPVSVPVSSSDLLTMFFRAEGRMAESEVPTVTKALEETEGVSNLKVRVLEGIANVELTKQTTVQATGVASNLVEIIQGSGFKLQALNLSFDDEDDIVN